MNRKLEVPVVAELKRSFWLGRTWEGRQQERVQSVEQAAPRRSVRRRCNLDVQIGRGSGHSESVQLRDLSLNGAFIKVHVGKLRAGSDVEVMLRYRYQGKQVECRLRATVTRTEGDGIAVRFGSYDNYTYTDLANLLYAQ